MSNYISFEAVYANYSLVVEDGQIVLKPFVDIPSGTQTNHQHNELLVSYLVYHPVIPDSNPIGLVKPGQLCAARWSWLCGKGIDFNPDSLKHL